MCAESDKREVTLQDIKQDIESLRHDMKQESRTTGSVTLVAFALTLVAFALTWVGIGLFFIQYSPTTYLGLGYFFIIIGIVLFVFGCVFYYRKIETPHKK